MSQITLKNDNGDDLVIDYNIALSGFSNTANTRFTVEYDIEKFNQYMQGSNTTVEVDSLTVENQTHFSVTGFRKNDEPCDFELPSGVTAIYGLTSSGKSELAKRISARVGGTFVRFHEPELPAITEYTELFKIIEGFLSSEDKILVIDSLRYMVYNTGEKRAAGKGGVTPGLYSDLTALSILASLVGKSIIVVINPMTDVDNDVKTIAHAIEGSVAGIIRSRSFGNFSVTARTLANRREAENFTFHADDSMSGEETKIGKGSNFSIDEDGEKGGVQLVSAATFNRLFERKE
jgi:hypothetical protein